MHIPVLLQEVLYYLDVRPGGRYIDATIGMGGHAKEIVKKGGMVLGIDRDPSVIPHLMQDPDLSASGGRFRGNDNDIIVVQGSFSEIKRIAGENGFTEADGILFDLGMGSHQLDDPARGFSFQREGPLDMRYDRGLTQTGRGQTRTAEYIVNIYSEKELVRIFREYGEERKFAKKVARAMVAARKIRPLETTTELYNLIKHPSTARRIFQALRIEVNQELENLEKALPQAVELLKGGGRLVVVSFHSLEDRIVKNFFNRETKDCICPPEFPVCRCQAKASLRILTKKPVPASEQETKINPRSKSAKLRVAIKI